MKYFNTLVTFAAILCLLAFPLLIGDTNVDAIAVNVLLLTGAAVAWNIFSGFTGYISLGHATYAGLGAYSLAIVCQDWHIPGGWGPFLLLPLVGLIVGAFAVPLGWIALHAERYTFLIITIAIFFIFQLLAYNLQSFTGGSLGIYLPNPDWSDQLLNLPFYFVACALLLIGMFVSWWIRHSKFGLGLLAIRDDEDRARGLGIRTDRYKLGAYVLSAILISMEGAISTYFLGFTSPSVAFDKSLDLTIVAASFLGGIGTVLGPLVGGLLFAPVQTFLIQQFGATATGLDQILFGVFLLVIILLLPEGIVSAFGKFWKEGQTSLFKKQVQIGIMEISSSSAALLLPAPVPIPIDLEVKSTNNQSILTEEQETHENALVSPTLTRQPLMPRRPAVILYAEQPLMLHWPATVLHNARDRRLVPFTGGKSLSSPEEVSLTPVVSWRCPDCSKPFVLRAGICYCPRCGIRREIIEGIS
jgi:branched-chain amino acid transport system permease protein